MTSQSWLFPHASACFLFLTSLRLYYTATSRERSGSSVQKYNPYPDYESLNYKSQFRGSFVSCRGVKGRRLNESDEDALFGLVGPLHGYPEGLLGSNRLLGLDQDVCFDRYGKHGAYGLPGGPGTGRELGIEWNKLDWAQLQQTCVQENRDRFDLTPRKKPDERDYFKDGDTPALEPQPSKRTAILIRGYQNMVFTEELKRNIRSVVTELALGSGGENEVFLLYNIKGLGRSIETLSSEEYHSIVDRNVPPEFRSMTVLWNEMLWPDHYPLIPDRARVVHTSQWLPVQWFAEKHPEFDFYFNWEMDVRYTGHTYDLVSKVNDWTKQQPRKGLWERNARFFIPRYHNDNFTRFSEIIRSRYTDEAKTESNDGTIWGPYPPRQQPLKSWDPAPPAGDIDEDWGVGEDADLVTFLPMFEPAPTHYAFLAAWFNYDENLRGHGGPPRRASIVTFVRLSNRLLNMMQIENTQYPGRHMGSEQFPAAISLHHGLKAVYAPHSIFMDRQWPAEAADFIFNNGDQQFTLDIYPYLPRTGAGSGGTDSVFGLGREHNFFNTSTFYYRAVLALELYKKWLGYEVDGVGGEQVCRCLIVKW
ncbi:MAG: hypothetical protein LQ340_006376 [Diploschistes diacapsis]|nr:MAG: hypothetical protein LQ340_006376 [Diploschistes diacapsis]